MTKNLHIDLNADLGEGMPYDKELLKHVSSCNIACGGHAGDKQTILDTLKIAKTDNVKIGVHPSYPDIKNFGRISPQLPIEKLINEIQMQLDLFQKCIEQSKANWHHIKFHGALYNDLKIDTKKAQALVELIKNKYNQKLLYVPPKSVIKTIAENQIPIKVEGFADRAYNEDLSLVSRQYSNAVLTKTDAVVEQVKNMVLNQIVKVAGGKSIPLKVDTICIHGDTPKALELVKKLVDELQKHQIKIQ